MNLLMWKKGGTVAFLAAPSITAGHSLRPQLDRTRLAQGAGAPWGCSDTPTQETLPVWGSCSIFCLLYVCSFIACTRALIFCQNLQGDSHEQWIFWAEDHYLGKSNSSHVFVVFLDTYLVAKQDVETRWEPCGSTSYLSTSLPTASWHERAC